ncbi:hypothetical protein GGS20DRAFT_544189 [Poronia punctata]|nr:hypothetical protein GGS20DRAFT_544189 [Poronia punctata]
MSNSHEAFKALGPTDWESFAKEDHKTLIADIFSDAYCLIDSIPVSLKEESQKTGRPRAATDSEKPISLPGRAEDSANRARELRKEWKDVKVNSRDNPLGINVYKLSAKDGKGAWFARRSVHEGLSFDRWKSGMEREFAESLKVQGEPGDGKIRGLGADKRVVQQTVDGCGKMEIYQLSARFPGPATPRDFVTLCLSSDTSAVPQSQSRYYMLVSKPCTHPECPQRQGFIRGTYESVEFIRELKVDKPPRKVRPSVDGDNGGQENALDGTGENEEAETIIEWVMITRSDPGGSVPRFMIERGTPPGISNDANKFFQWISSSEFEKLLEQGDEDAQDEKASGADPSPATGEILVDSHERRIDNGPEKPRPITADEDAEKLPGPGGVYGVVSGALGVASAAASRLLGTATESDTSSPYVSDDDSSTHSFHSCDTVEDAQATEQLSKEPSPSVSTGGGNKSAESVHSMDSTTRRSSHHEKELKKLEDRRRKMEEKLERAQERALAKKNNETQRDEQALQKLQEKHERAMAKQEEKYQRERKKLEAKRANEEKKAEERRRKQVEREEKANIALELQKVRAERDVARKEIEILTEQVGQLQTMNTKLVARLGREGVEVSQGDETTVDSGPGSLRRVVTDKDVDLKLSNGSS